MPGESAPCNSATTDRLGMTKELEGPDEMPDVADDVSGDTMGVHTVVKGDDNIEAALVSPAHM